MEQEQIDALPGVPLLRREMSGTTPTGRSKNRRSVTYSRQVTKSVLMDISSGLATDLAANSRLDASNTASNTFFTLVNKQNFQKVPFSTDLASVEPIDDPTTVEIDAEETSAKRVSTLPLTDNPIDSLSNTSKQKTVHVASFGQQQTPPTSPERLKASGYRQPLPFGCFCYGCLMFCY